MAYFRCILKNYLVLIGFTLDVAGVALFFTEDSLLSFELDLLLAVLFLWIGSFLLAVTQLGLDTLKAYRRIIRHIRRFRTLGGLDIYRQSYCRQKALELALDEMHLKDFL